MNFVKKWISTIISFVAGVCGLAFSACSGMVTDIVAKDTQLAQGLKAMGLTSNSTKAFKVLTDGDLYTEAKAAGIGDEFMVMKVFAIITLIVSIILIIYAIVMLLKNLDVIKYDSKIFDIVGICLFALLLIATIGLLISSNAFANAQEDKLTAALTAMGYISMVNIKVGLGVYQPIMLVVAIVSALAVSTFTFINRKHA